MGKKLKRKVSMRINKKDGTYKDLNIVQAVQMNAGDEGRMYLEEVKDGNYRLMWTPGIIDEFSDIINFEILREDI